MIWERAVLVKSHEGIDGPTIGGTLHGYRGVALL